MFSSLCYRDHILAPSIFGDIGIKYNNNQNLKVTLVVPPFSIFLGCGMLKYHTREKTPKVRQKTKLRYVNTCIVC